MAALNPNPNPHPHPTPNQADLHKLRDDMRKAASEGIEGSKLAEAVMRKVRPRCVSPPFPSKLAEAVVRNLRLRVKVTARAIRKVRARAIHHDAYYRY